MTSYAKLRWDIVIEWNSDAKYTNSYLIDMASDLGVEIRNKSADRKSIIAKVADGVIKSGIESGEYSVTDWGELSQEQTNFENYMGSLGVPEPELDLVIDSDAHEHDDGTVHSHEGGSDPHTHEEEYTYEDKEEEELPDFNKMTKKALDDWALEQGIELDRRQTKANMLEELKGKLN